MFYLSNKALQELDCLPAMKASKIRQTLLFGAAILFTAAMWGFVLPHLAQQPAMRDKVEHLHQLGIDSGAMFYSDHPAAFSEGYQPKADR